MSRSRRFLGGLAFTYGYQALVMITGLWLTPFLLRRIGQHDYGLWLAGTQLLAYLGLTDLGVVALLPQQTAYATGRSGGAESAADLPVLVGQTVRLVLYQLPIVIALAAALWFSILAKEGELRGPLMIVLAGFILLFPLRILPALLQGLQDLSFTGRMQILNWVLGTAAMVLMVLAGWNLYALASSWVIGQAAMMPVFLYRLLTRFPGVLPRRPARLTWECARRQLGNGFWVSVAQIAQALMTNTDLLIIGRLLGPAAVVPYACTGKLASVLANQAQILMQTATPGLCELKAGESRQRLFQAILGLNQGILALSGLICVVILVNRWFVGWWVTAGQYGGALLTFAILANILVTHWDTVAAYSVFCLGRQRRIAVTNLGNGIVTAGGAYALAMLIGPIGVPLGSMAGTCLVGLPLNLSVIARDTGNTLHGLTAAMIGSFSWRFAVPGAVALLAGIRWSPATFAAAATAATGISILYALLILPGILRSPLEPYLRPWLDSFRRRYRMAGFEKVSQSA
jgi:O-antigen/teichoic acid export membrane protein